jgi:uncharacterized membrane protein
MTRPDSLPTANHAVGDGDGADHRELDVSARAGMLLGAYYTGLSYQPNLLSRGTRDQSIISGVAASVGYGWGVTAHSFLRSFADRLPGARSSKFGRVVSGAIVDWGVVAGSLAALRALPPKQHESRARSFARLAAMGFGSAAAAGVGAGVLGAIGGRARGPATLLATLATTAATYRYTMSKKPVAGALDAPDNRPHEDVVRDVSTPKAMASSLVVAGVLAIAARGESNLSGLLARGAAKTMGGNPDDHRTVGRLGAAAVTAAIGWGAVTFASNLLTKPGTAVEPAHATPPDIPEVTGGPGSLSSWADQTRESRRWLSMVLTPEEINKVMSTTKAKQPIRVYGSLDSTNTPEERAELLLAEIDRTKALERPYFALFSPTGSGYVNYVACETLEYLTKGNCASAAIQYSVLPSALSLTKVPDGTNQTRMVMNGIMQRLLEMPRSKRPKIFMFGESLGSQVSEDMFHGQGITGPEGIGLDAAVWIGTPSATQWKKELWGNRDISQPPQLGPGPAYISRAIRDWRNLAADAKAQVKYLLLQNGDDPIPKFGTALTWRQPDWLGPTATRPPGSPRNTKWMPIVTFIATFIDMQNALTPTPGVFEEGGHDYRRETPEAIRHVFGLEVSDKDMASVQEALRARELEWEARRRWAVAESQPTPKRGEAEEKVEKLVEKWTGKSDVNADDVEQIAAGEVSSKNDPNLI